MALRLKVSLVSKMFIEIRLDLHLTCATADLDRLAKVEVQYATLPGWKTDISNCKTYEEFPENAKAYIKFIEDYLGVKVQYVGVGPGRDQNVIIF